jgi:hypothetical protein
VARVFALPSFSALSLLTFLPRDRLPFLLAFFFRAIASSSVVIIAGLPGFFFLADVRSASRDQESADIFGGVMARRLKTLLSARLFPSFLLFTLAAFFPDFFFAVIVFRDAFLRSPARPVRTEERNRRGRGGRVIGA